MHTWIIAALYLFGLAGLQEPVEVINGTFLGNWERNYYGNEAPDTLGVIWQHMLGTGKTRIGRTNVVKWSGAGWTGQPLMTAEDGDTFLVLGAYDHRLKKINAANGKLIWEYAYDDVIKGTGTLWYNRGDSLYENRWVILQGSRLGTDKLLDSTEIYSFRAVSYRSGEELWRHNVKRTRSYSRDVDASALVWNDTLYIGLENSLFTLMDPDPSRAERQGKYNHPVILDQQLMYFPEDVVKHGGNLVTEASPAKLGDMIYIASGSGRVWGYDMKSDSLSWSFYTGSDMDGTTVVTGDSCLLASVERQYIKGEGGILKLDPSKAADEAVVWYLPVKNKDFAGWEGGVIGSAAVSDRYNDLHLGACLAIDGYLYVFRHDSLSGKKVTGFDGKTTYPSPAVVFKYKVGESISTPIFTGNRLVACGYEGVYLFAYDEKANFRLLDHRPMPVESTPFTWNRRIYIASRNGYLYCLGAKD